MIDQIRFDEILAITKDLEGMLKKHVEWLTLLHKTIICDLPSLSSVMRHYQTCDFGKWYYSVSLPMVTQNPEFVHLGSSHKQLHALANRILEQYESSNTVEEKEYDAFVVSEQKFFDAFNTFIENILSAKSQFDHLTNLPNRGLITLVLEKEYSVVERGIDECCVAFADIDHFKNVNDTYGHATGDKVLTEVARCFTESIRPYDTVGRYGGEEFIFCLPRTSLENARNILERVRRGIEACVIPSDESIPVQVTCSFGLTEMHRDIPLTEVINRADNSMYTAKNNGRNRIEVWSDAG